MTRHAAADTGLGGFGFGGVAPSQTGNQFVAWVCPHEKFKKGKMMKTNEKSTKKMKYFDCVSQYVVDLFLSHCGACASVNG